MKYIITLLLFISICGCTSNSKPPESNLALIETDMFIRSFNTLQDECQAATDKAINLSTVHSENSDRLRSSNINKGRMELDSAYWYIGYATAYRDAWKSINDKANHIRDSLKNLNR